MVAFFFWRCLTLKYQLVRSATYQQFWSFCSTTPTNIPLLRFVSPRCCSCLACRVASPPPRRDGAALGGWERSRRCGRAADLCRDQGGRGQQKRPWPQKGFRFSSCFGSGSGEVMEGVRGAANFFVILDVAWYLLLKVPLVCLDGPLKIRVGKRQDVRRCRTFNAYVLSIKRLKKTGSITRRRERVAEDVAFQNVGQQAG